MRHRRGGIDCAAGKLALHGFYAVYNGNGTRAVTGCTCYTVEEIKIGRNRTTAGFPMMDEETAYEAGEKEAV